MPWDNDFDDPEYRSLLACVRANSARPGRALYLPIRAATEFVACAVLLVLSAPLVFLTAALVRLTSRGPAFFAQTRVGLDGRAFRIYKIRSMYQDCEKWSGPCWASKRDSRITPLGHVLRATHIDELPQLVNVLKGEMSLIGPRPERPEFLPKLARAIPRYRERLSVRPGVTGFAQIQLPADTDLDSVREKLKYDLYYIDAVSPWLDLCIVLCTVLRMVGIPFHMLRRPFGMPTAAEVGESFRVSHPHPVPQPQPV